MDEEGVAQAARFVLLLDFAAFAALAFAAFVALAFAALAAFFVPCALAFAAGALRCRFGTGSRGSPSDSYSHPSSKSNSDCGGAVAAAARVVRLFADMLYRDPYPPPPPPLVSMRPLLGWELTAHSIQRWRGHCTSTCTQRQALAR